MTAKNKEEIKVSVIQLISSQFNISVEQVTGGVSLRDLNADSLDMVELVMKLEEEFGIEIPEEKVPELKTVDDLVDFIGTSVGV